MREKIETPTAEVHLPTRLWRVIVFKIPDMLTCKSKYAIVCELEYVYECV